jgi:sugar/nucleoside kinase (ribokinase family)
VVAGFDGFVDTILHAVSERRSLSEYVRIPTLKSLSETILAASGGRNVNIEVAPQQTKIGGNGPIFANAMAHLGIQVSYIGCLGLSEISPSFRCALRESTFIARAIGLIPPEDALKEVLKYAKKLRERLRIDTVVIHWSQGAVASAVESDILVETLFTDKPQISTGAGDHFNTGFCLSRLLGGDMNANVRLGIATSGYYVRQAHSPTLAQLIEFVRTLS